MKNSQAWRLLADYGVSIAEPTAAVPRSSPAGPRFLAWLPRSLRDLSEIVLVVALTLLTVLLFALAIYANAARALLQILRGCLHLPGAAAKLDEQNLWDWPQADAGKGEDQQPGGLD